MANPYIPFLGFPSWDPSGAIMAQDAAFYGQPQGVTVYDLISRGYNPGHSQAFFDTLPNLTTAAQFGEPIAPVSGFYPAGDFSYLGALADAAQSQYNAQQTKNVIDAGVSGAKTISQGFGNGFGGFGGFSSTAGDVSTWSDVADIPPPSWFSSIGEAAAPFLNYLPYAGAALGGILSFIDGNYAKGAGTLGGAAIGTAIFPGIGTGLGALAGGLLGDLIGNDQPSKAWITFPERLGRTLGTEQGAQQALSDALANAKSTDDVYNALRDFRAAVGSHVGGYGGTEGLVYGSMPGEFYYQGPPPNYDEGGQLYGPGSPEYIRAATGNLLGKDELFGDLNANLMNALPDIPGATGNEHEGKVSFDPADSMQALRDQLLGTTQALTAQQYLGPATTLAQAIAGAQTPDQLQQALSTFYSGIGSDYGKTSPAVSTFGAAPGDDVLSSAIPDFPGLTDQSAAQGLRQELGSAYTGLVNKTNPFTGRAGLPAPMGTSGSQSVPGTRIGVGVSNNQEALGSAIANAEEFLAP